MKQDLREALPKVRNPPFLYFKEGKNKEGFVKPAPDSTCVCQCEHCVLLPGTTWTQNPSYSSQTCYVNIVCFYCC